MSSENKETVRGEDIYFVGVTEDGQLKESATYHRIWCPHLTGDKIRGYNKIDFENLETSGHKETLACYYCMVHASNPSLEYAQEYYNNTSAEYKKRRAAYMSALANEKQKLEALKQTGYIRGSAALEQ